jgi:hypothetical protein
MLHLSWIAETQIGSCCVPRYCLASISDALLIVPVGLLDQSLHWMGSLIIFFCLWVYPDDVYYPYFERECFTLYKSDMFYNSANALRQFDKETPASLTLLKLWMEQKNSCFVFFIVPLINQYVPSFFLNGITSTHRPTLKQNSESSTILTKKNYH